MSWKPKTHQLFHSFFQTRIFSLLAVTVTASSGWHMSRGIIAVEIVSGFYHFSWLELSTSVIHTINCSYINPYDAKSVDMSPSPGATAGLDFAGEVVALGEAVDSTSSRLALGKRVCGFVFGNNPDRRDNGAFAEYVAVPASLVLCIPESMTFLEAATLPCGLATTGGALYNSHSLGLPLLGSGSEVNSSNKSPTYVLVYGGSTATATLIIQVLRRHVYM
jgi:NADPH:quinone reductase and related Zn-dependent oxidoreductases